MVVDDVHFLFLFSSWFWLILTYLMMLNEWEWMKVVCWSMKMKLIIWQSFLSFLQSWKQTMNEISTSFALFFIFAILMIVSISRKTKTIIILFLLLDCDLINRDFDQIDRNHRNFNCICKVRFEFDFYFFIWELLKTIKVETDLKSAYSQQLVKLKKGNMNFGRETKVSLFYCRENKWKTKNHIMQ